MAEVDASFPKAEDGNLKIFFPDEQDAKNTTTDQSNCSRCHKMVPVCVCVDCGGISLCNNCNRTVHQGSGESKKRHRINGLFPSHCDDTKANGIAEGKLIDFDQYDDDDDFATLFDAQPTSFLLVDGSERLQVGHYL